MGHLTINMCGWKYVLFLLKSLVNIFYGLNSIVKIKKKKTPLFYDWNYSQYYGFRSPWTLGSLSWSAMRMWYLDEHMYRYNVFTNSTYRYFLISYHKFYAVFVCTDSVFISMGKYILTPPQPHTILMTCIVGRLHQLSNVDVLNYVLIHQHVYLF